VPSLINEKSILTDFTIAPNPSIDHNLTLSFNLLHCAYINIKVYDIQGNILLSVNDYFQEGDNSFSLDITSLSISSYLCRLFYMGNIIGTTNFIKN